MADTKQQAAVFWQCAHRPIKELEVKLHVCRCRRNPNWSFSATECCRTNRIDRSFQNYIASHAREVIKRPVSIASKWMLVKLGCKITRVPGGRPGPRRLERVCAKSLVKFSSNQDYIQPGPCRSDVKSMSARATQGRKKNNLARRQSASRNCRIMFAICFEAACRAHRNAQTSRTRRPAENWIERYAFTSPALSSRQAQRWQLIAHIGV